jgi:uncharacterized delta-60 repeat protein
MTGGSFDLVRYNNDGSLDSSFGAAGKVSTDFGNGGTTWARDSALQADGKIVVVGEVYGEGSQQFAVVRYNSDGSLDTSFNGTGEKLTNVDSADQRSFNDIASTVAIQQDGKILVGGKYSQQSHTPANISDYALVRYNSDGSLDTSFNGTGYVSTDLGATETVTRLLIQADGKILAAGISDYIFSKQASYFDLVRYNSDGTLDTSFNHTGIVKTHLTAPAQITNLDNVLLQADGKILVVGGSTPVAYAATAQSYESDVTLLRYNADGSIDTSFGGGDGMVTSPFAYNSNSNSNNYHATLLADGKILVSGSITDAGQGLDFAVVRYNSDGSVDTAFGLSNTVTTSNGAAAVVLDGNVQIKDAALDALNGGQGNYGGASVTLARHGGANADDVFAAVNPAALNHQLTLSNNTALLDGKAIGTYQQLNGQFTLTFNAFTSSTTVKLALQHLGYTNTAAHPAAAVQIDWLFSDGKGSNPLSALKTTDIHIEFIDHTPQGHVTVDGTQAAGQTLTASNGLSDADGLGAISYQWQAKSGGTWHTVATSTSLVLTQAMLSQTLKVIARYTDGAGFHDSVTSLFGSVGNDVLNTSNSNGVLYGGGGNDTLLGGVGSDILNGGAGNDFLKGGTGAFLYNGSSIVNTVDVLNGGDGNDVLQGEIGYPYVSEILDGGAGSDWVSYSNTLGVSVDLSRTDTQDISGYFGGTNAAMETLSNIENINGSGYADSLTGTAGNNVLFGNGGDDYLSGLDGNDTLSGGAGLNNLDGGNGNDWVTYGSAIAGVTANLEDALFNLPVSHQEATGEGSDFLSSIENISGSAFGDTLTGDGGNNVLMGGAGNDILDGGLGRDTLIGGQGQDTFVFGAFPGFESADHISDFSVTDDSIELISSINNQYVYEALPSGELATDAFKIIGNGGTEDSSDRILYNSGNGLVFYDADGKGGNAPELFAIVGAHLALTAADFFVA